MKIIKINAYLERGKFKSFVTEYEAEEKTKTYRLTELNQLSKGYKVIDRSMLMKAGNDWGQYVNSINYYIYFFPENAEEAKKIIKEKFEQKLNEFTEQLEENKKAFAEIGRLK